MITERRPNVYYRFINKGFNSCKCPEKIKNCVNYEDVELLNWFPNLDIKKESKIHNYLRKNYKNYGEWYCNTKIDDVVKVIKEFGGIPELPSEIDLIKAKEWCNNLNRKKRLDINSTYML